MSITLTMGKSMVVAHTLAGGSLACGMEDEPSIYRRFHAAMRQIKFSKATFWTVAHVTQN
jgi:hypothetical protein